MPGCVPAETWLALLLGRLSVAMKSHSVSWQSQTQAEGPIARQVFAPLYPAVAEGRKFDASSMYGIQEITRLGQSTAMSKIRVLGYSPVWDLIMCYDSECNYTPCCIVLDGGRMKK